MAECIETLWGCPLRCQVQDDDGSWVSLPVDLADRGRLEIDLTKANRALKDHQAREPIRHLLRLVKEQLRPGAVVHVEQLPPRGGYFTEIEKAVERVERECLG